VIGVGVTGVGVGPVLVDLAPQESGLPEPSRISGKHVIVPELNDEPLGVTEKPPGGPQKQLLP